MVSPAKHLPLRRVARCRRRPLRQRRPGAGQSRPATIQRFVRINAAKPYDENEVILSFGYARDGSAGGNHFVSDMIIRNVISELVMDKKRGKALDVCKTLWAASGFRGDLHTPVFTKTSQLQ